MKLSEWIGLGTTNSQSDKFGGDQNPGTLDIEKITSRIAQAETQGKYK